MITGRQEKLLEFLVREYIETSEPVSSKALKKAGDLDVCGATIRNDMQELMKQGFIEQPHTSAGRIPTKKAYKYFAEKMAEQKEQDLSDFIVRQIQEAHRQIEQEMKLAQELMATLSETSLTLTVSNMTEGDDLFEILNILGSSKTIFGKDMDVINEIIKKLGNF
jgi:heat-inducible transcriptional repressor